MTAGIGAEEGRNSRWDCPKIAQGWLGFWQFEQRQAWDAGCRCV